MQLDKIKGTLVDFNQLEHVLDDAPNVGAWQLELRKRNDDPLELDEIILHVHKLNNASEEQLRRELNNRFVERTEIHPNRIVFEDAEELRRRHGVGTQLKEQKIIDHRPGSAPAEKTGQPDLSAAVPPASEESRPPGSAKTPGAFAERNLEMNR